MLLIQTLTASALQTQNIVLPNGSTFSLTLKYIEMQYGWFIQSLTYNDFQLNGVRVTNIPNILYQWKNTLPFGLACFSIADREPTQLEDFASKASQLFVLTEDEVNGYAEFIKNG